VTASPLPSQALSKLALWRQKRERELSSPGAHTKDRDKGGETLGQLHGEAAPPEGGDISGHVPEHTEGRGGQAGLEPGQGEDTVELGGWAVVAGQNCTFEASVEGQECGGLRRFSSGSLQECQALCCEYVPCNVWQWIARPLAGQPVPPSISASEGSAPEDASGEGACWLGLGSLEFPCFPVSEGEGAFSYQGMRRKVPAS